MPANLFRGHGLGVPARSYSYRFSQYAEALSTLKL